MPYISLVINLSPPSILHIQLTRKHLMDYGKYLFVNSVLADRKIRNMRNRGKYKADSRALTISRMNAASQTQRDTSKFKAS